MFDFFNKKTKKNIICTIIVTLVIEFIAIFFSYSLLQFKEYLSKAENTSKQNSRYIELCMNHHENNLSSFIENNLDKFMSINHFDLYDLFKEFTISNNHISNVFFYSDSSLFSYNTLSYELNNYISTIRQNKNYPLTSQWVLLNKSLLYSYPIVVNSNFYGCFVICMPPNTLTLYNKNDYNNTITVLHSQEGTKTLIGDTESLIYDFEKIPDFTASEYSHTSIFTHINNFPLPEKEISIITITPLSQAFKRIVILGICLGFILLISILLAFYFINKYNEFLIARLEHLSADISEIPNNLSKEEMQHENFE